jgi:hypothetical protein
MVREAVDTRFLPGIKKQTEEITPKIRALGKI